MTHYRRELFEETGIKSDKFEKIGVSIEDDKHGIYHSYLAIVNCEKDSLKLQSDETINFKWISKEAFMDFTKTDQMGKDQKFRYATYIKSLEQVL